MENQGFRIYTAGQVLTSGAKRGRDKIAIQYLEDHEIVNVSYESFIRDIRQVVLSIKEHQMDGTHIAVLGDNNYKWLITMFGILCSGSVAVLIDKNLTSADVESQLLHAEVKTIFYGEKYNSIVDKACAAGGISKICFEKTEYQEFLSYSNADNVEFCRDENRLCLLLFTSGTTGKSKGVMILQKNIAFAAMEAPMQYQEKTDDKVIVAVPFFHAFGLFALFESIYRGKTVCLNEDIKYVLRDCKKMEPNIMYTVPMIAETSLRQLQAARRSDRGIGLERLRAILIAGAALGNPEETIQAYEKLGVCLLVCYGLTETLLVSTECDDCRRMNSVGKTFGVCEVKLEEGEIWVKGNSVCAGYFKNQAAVNESFSGGWFRTGDLGKIDKDGFIYITGRLKNLIIRDDGNNVSPEELEQKIMKMMPYITEVLVWQDGNHIIAEIYCECLNADVLKKKLETDMDELNQNLPMYKMIDKYVIRDIPFIRTNSKKIRRR